MDKSIEKEKRVSKSNKHFEIYLEYVKMYNVLKLKWTVQRGYISEIQNIWHDMTRKLNGCGGPVRDVTHWKKVFTEWKSHTRKKLKCNKPLNDIEKQLVEIMGLTSNPERKKKSVKAGKAKTATDNTKLSADNKENNPLVKEERDDSAGSSDDTSFIEQMTITRRDETQSGSHVLGEQTENQSNSTQPPVNISGTSKDLSKDRSSNVSTQVDQVMLDIPNISDIASVGVALQSLSNAVNRYCDIVERRIF